jgi:hypothetical protein
MMNAMIARMKLLAGPAIDTIMLAFFLSLQSSGLVCTGLAHPNNIAPLIIPTSGKMIVP